MLNLPEDPFSNGGLPQFYHDFRNGVLSSEQATEIYLERIRLLDPKLEAFDYVDEKQALATAKAMDLLIAAGTDLGPLMGVPIAIKDIFTINNMPAARAGSLINLEHLSGDKEGPFIQALHKSGCVFLGKTKAVELCLGITGVSAPLGTPWNPWDATSHRIPGGSSSGSGVAVAAGLCAFAIGSDSGGSIRVPAAFNGIFGLKTTFGLWPVAGAIPLDERVDSIGLMTKSAADAQLAYHEISAQLFGYSYCGDLPVIELDRLRFGMPSNYFFEELSSENEAEISAFNQLLEQKGVRFDAVTIGSAAERQNYFPLSMPASIIAAIGKETFEGAREAMDPIVSARVETGLFVKASDFLAAEKKRQKNIQQVKKDFAGFDAWVSPTTVDIAPKMSAFDDLAHALNLAFGMTRNTQPANYLELCAVSLPMPRTADQMPLGYQLMATAGHEANLLAIAVAIEKTLPKSAQPNLDAFLA